MPDRWDPAGHRQSHMAEHPRTGNTGNSSLNISLVKAIKHVGPTLTSIFGALEPLTAIVIGCCVFKESFTWSSTIGIALIVTAVIIVITRENSMGKVRK